MKRFKKVMSAVMCVVLMGSLAVSLIGCKQDAAIDAGDRTIIYYNATGCDINARPAYEKMVNTYNETQGVVDGVWVQASYNAGEIPGLESQLGANYRYDVVGITDMQFKTLAYSDLFVDLTPYITEEVKTAMQWEEIPQSMFNRFSMNTTINTSYNKYDAGQGTKLQALPNGSEVHALYYNEEILNACGINVVSCEEEKLAETYPKLQPHGYAEYLDEPFAGAVASENELGETVYKVFNNRIAMNWEELRCVARMFQKKYNYQYGYMSEWWFNYGWGVGGDCIGWNTETNSYEFTICDKQDNYLVLEDVVVNGNAYSAGDILRYEDKTSLNKDAAALSAIADKLYVLPSQYDAFLEFNRLGVEGSLVNDVYTNNTSETVFAYGYTVAPGQTVNITGYGVAPNSIVDKTKYFTAGTSPFLVEEYGHINSFAQALDGAADIAPNVQYRAYVGGSTYQKDGADGFANEYLKVIGKEYDGQVYTGELMQIKGTPIVGKQTAANAATGLALPKNTSGKKYDAAFKFISWAAGPEGQRILAESNDLIPNQTSVALSDEFNNGEDRLCDNRWAAGFTAMEADIGDYSYFQHHTWIDAWSQQLNGDVREGKLTLTQFLNNKLEAANQALAGMYIRILGR